MKTVCMSILFGISIYLSYTRKNTDIRKYNLFSSLFFNRNVQNGRVRERVEDGQDVHTRGDRNRK